MITKIKHILTNPEKFIGKVVEIAGWVKTVRAQKNVSFMHINDGSCFSNLQIIGDINDITTGSSVKILGEIMKSPAQGQPVEMKAKDIHIFGKCDVNKYPLQKKTHSFEFLRTIAHLRSRTNTQGALARVREELTFATHKFFHDNGFLFLPAPIITGSDCEGGGELFRVTTLPPKEENLTKDYFGKAAYLTVSGQLNAETFACALGSVYTFGPTFRAEGSETSRHLSEFWMIEPEMAFCDINCLMDTAEKYIKYMVEAALTNCKEDLLFFDNFLQKGLISKLEKSLKNPFTRVSYTDAIAILEKSGQNFEFPVKWGISLQSEHERFLAEKYFNNIVIVYNYPKDIKAFYMRQNEDGKTVAAMDILAPGIGEIVGGSQREERLDILQQKLKEFKLKEEDYWWYLELREYGSVPHAGFGLGFERFLYFVTGIENIRDLIPFPRYPGHVEF
jgi:asparaginyl-tRNA synthetase